MVICSPGFTHYNPLQLFDVTWRRSTKTTLRLYDALFSLLPCHEFLISNNSVSDDIWDSRNIHMLLSQPQTVKVIVWDTDITPGLSKLYYLRSRGVN